MLRNSRKTVPKHVTALSRKRSFSPLFHSSGKWNGAAKVNGQHLSLYQSLALSFISHTHKRTLSNMHPHLNLQSSHSRTHSFSLSLHHTNTFFSQALTLTLKHKYAPFLSHSLFCGFPIRPNCFCYIDSGVSFRTGGHSRLKT